MSPPYALLDRVRRSPDLPLLAELLQESGWQSDRLRVIKHPSGNLLVAESAGLPLLAVPVGVPGKATEDAPGEAREAVALAYSAESPYTLLWTRDLVRLLPTRRWAATPGDVSLASADTASIVDVRNVVGLLTPEIVPALGSGTGGRQRPALPDALAQAFADARAALFQQGAWREDDTRAADLRLMQMFHQILFVRFFEDRHRTDPPVGARISALLDGSQPGERLVGLLSQYADVFDSSLFGEAATDPRDLPADRLHKLLRATVEPWEGLSLDFGVTPRDVAGRLYESYLSRQPQVREEMQALLPLVGAADRRLQQGAFYTPGALAGALVDQTLSPWLARNRPRDPSEVTVLDPACGSGAFLVAAFRHLCGYFARQEGLQTCPEEVRREVLLRSIHGADIDPSALLLAQVQLLEEADLGEGRLPPVAQNLTRGDSVVSPPGSSHDQGAVDWAEKTPSRGWDLVLSNPPFRANRQLDPAYRRLLQSRYPRTNDPKVDLAARFVDLADALLSDDGALGMVLPRTFLTGESARGARAVLAHRGVSAITDFRGSRLFSVAAYVATVSCTGTAGPATVLEVVDSRSSASRVLDSITGDGKVPQDGEDPLLRSATLTDRPDGTGPWTPFYLRWAQRLCKQVHVPWVRVREAAGVVVRQGTQTGSNSRFTVPAEDVLPGPGPGQVTVRGHSVDARFVPYLVDGPDVLPFRLAETGRRLVLPLPARRGGTDALAALVRELGGAPENVQPGDLVTLMAPKVVLRAFALEPAAAVDSDGDTFCIKGTGGALVLRPVDPHVPLDAVMGLLNSSLYQWLMRGLGQPRADETVEVRLADLEELPWPTLKPHGWRSIAERAESARLAAVAVGSPAARLREYARARRALDDTVLDLLEVEPELRDTVRRELVREGG